MNTKSYLKCIDYQHINLDRLYNGECMDILDYNLQAIITTEAPITLNILKERFREVFELKKISGKALDIIMEHINNIGFPQTDNLYDIVFWPEEGIFTPEYLRLNYDRQIYDIPYQELTLLSKDLISKGFKGEPLYREILKYFGYEVLTEKALNYLQFIESKSR